MTGDETEVHGSWRYVRRHAAWALDPQAPAVAASDPWTPRLQGSATQALLGASWTGAQQQSALVEWWYDGSALADAQWRAWRDRLAALRAVGAAAPAAALAGNLGWQAQPLAGLEGSRTLRRHNVLLRVAQQTGPWTASFDVLMEPADRGYRLTPTVKWQGDRLSWEFGWRHSGGPEGALFSELPIRDTAVVWGRWAF